MEDQDLTWDAAETRCVEEGGHLASITSESIKDAVKDQIMKSVWTGARRLEGEQKWSWADGSAWSYESWVEGAPKPLTEKIPGGNCGQLDKIENMEDSSCEEEVRSVCSRKYCPSLSTSSTFGIVVAVAGGVALVVAIIVAAVGCNEK